MDHARCVRGQAGSTASAARLLQVECACPGLQPEMAMFGTSLRTAIAASRKGMVVKYRPPQDTKGALRLPGYLGDLLARQVLHAP